MLTQLAGTRVVRAVAARLGRDLDDAQAHTAMRWVKTQAYRSGRAVVDDVDFGRYLDGLETDVTEGPR